MSCSHSARSSKVRIRRLGLLAASVALLACRQPAESSRTADPAAGASGAPWFREVTEELGLDFQQEPGARGEHFLPEIMGAGAALFDADGDGDLDIYLTNGNWSLPEGGRQAGSPDRFFLREATGFVDATAESGLGDTGYGQGVAVADYDNDGDLDVYVTTVGPDQLYRNDGEARFTNVTQQAGIDVRGWSTSAGFFDYDQDGWLDLYVARYTASEDRTCLDSLGRKDYCSPIVYEAETDVLLHAEGDGSFRDVTAESGIAAVRSAGLGVVFEDFDEDGRIDVFVANDAYANNLWLNQGEGRFRDEALQAGLAYNALGTAEAGMGVVSADLDGDAVLDLFLTHMRGETNTYYRARGNTRFEDATGASGLARSSLLLTGFGTAAFDIELDGDLDLVVANGRISRSTVLPGAPAPPWDAFAEPNSVLLGSASGRWEDAGARGGKLTTPVEVSRGLVVGDLDQDGDLDVLVANIAAPARLYLNEAPRSGHWLQVRAVDPKLGRDALGSRILIRSGDTERVASLTSTSSYLCSGPALVHFGLGDAETVDEVRVRWPDNEWEVFPGGAVDRSLTLRRGEGSRLP